eukprot:521366-Pyramimonas_sp.AAC.1
MNACVATPLIGHCGAAIWIFTLESSWHFSTLIAATSSSIFILVTTGSTPGAAGVMPSKYAAMSFLLLPPMSQRIKLSRRPTTSEATGLPIFWRASIPVCLASSMALR